MAPYRAFLLASLQQKGRGRVWVQRRGEEEERAPSDKGRGEEREKDMKRRVRFLSEVLGFKG